MSVETVNGAAIHTQRLGTQGPRVVMLHGMMIGSIASWYFSVAPGIARDHRVLMYDLRGHGLSEATSSGYGVRAMASDLDGLVTKFAGDAPVSLVGHSYGAVIALRFALDHPSRVKRLVVIEAPLPLITEGQVETYSNATHASIVAMMPPWQRDAFATGGRRAQRLSARAYGLVKGTTMIDEMMAEPDIDDRELATLRVPVLLCYGTRTSAFLAATCTRLAALLPLATVQMIEAGHYVTRDAPARLAATIREYLDA